MEKNIDLYCRFEHLLGVKNLSPENISRYEEQISKNPYCATYYAVDILKGKFPLGEKSISTEAFYSYKYASEVLKDRFPLGEEAISKEFDYSYFYASEVLKDRFPLGEEAISKMAGTSVGYTNLIGGRFKLGEEAIFKNKEMLKTYKQLMKKILSEDDYILFLLEF